MKSKQENNMFPFYYLSVGPETGVNLIYKIKSIHAYIVRHPASPMMTSANFPALPKIRGQLHLQPQPHQATPMSPTAELYNQDMVLKKKKKMTMANKNNDLLTLGHWNANGLTEKWTELKNFIFTHNIDVMLVNETKLTKRNSAVSQDMLLSYRIGRVIQQVEDYLL
ncbi:hypothetical protein KQX54_014177 [Cotesia glomerata]|uniref:Uncharacterized protein n=1 Tax=Cotesia glomerata TaxID=32391 RepID=A0AAV7I956_COTGL|nr:hypothetical protein KQX54_014177 [Cotesia glomerata]